jgi:ribose 1,5-bisphosphate isomerase
MISQKIKELAKDIKEIKIQGASNIEKESINTIINYIKENKKEYADFIQELYENIQHIIIQRPNEPKLRNSMTYILNWAQNYNNLDTRKELIDAIEKLYEKTKEGIEISSENASKMLLSGDVVLTHCHSSLVEKSLIKAHENGTKITVFCTETRPRYQGRITAKNLCDAGLDVTMIVDSDVCGVLKKADHFLTGADVVLADGSVINKVGTHAISIIAGHYKVPHTVITTTHICEPILFNNLKRTVEQRDIKEVWENKPDNLKIRNPAFDVVPNNLIEKFITEEGIFTPETLYFWINKANTKNLIKKV